MKKEILCTLGPASLKKTVIERMNDLPVSLFRINLSHTPISELSGIIRLIRKFSKKPICIDTEGAQIRTRRVIGSGVMLQEGSYLALHKKNVPGGAQNVSIHPPEAIDQIQIYDFLTIDFNNALVQVIEKHPDWLKTKIITEGVIASNKAITVNRSIAMDPMTQKDREAIAIALKYEIRDFALSFAGKAEDVEELRALVGNDSRIISKIESASGVDNLEDIAEKSDALLIDRGDLSRECPIEAIPLLQKRIIEKVKKKGSKVYVATNLLETMVTQSRPTRAEVNDVFNTLLDGADGLVLAAETAIGNNPVGCVNMIAKMIGQYENFTKFGTALEKFDPRSLLIEPHGGVLVNRLIKNPDLEIIKSLPKLSVDEKVVLDCEQIAKGVYSPLEGFMGREEIESVLDNYNLPCGTAWSLPVFLQTQKEYVGGLGKGDSVGLEDKRTGKVFAILHVTEIFEMNIDTLNLKMFGSESASHPGVSMINNGGDRFIGGKIDLISPFKRESELAPYLLDPVDTRMIFEQKNWYRVVGFHTRNVIHRGHEFIQKSSLEDYHCDGLFVSPVIGPKKKDDFHGEIVLRAYQTMVDFNLYPKNKVVIGTFATYSRYAGPREAVFTAICRKNFGCSHFVIGRDHTGVKNFYPPDASLKIFKKIGDIGIVPIFFDEVAYCESCNNHRTACKHSESNILRISGTKVREILSEGRVLPSWLIRDEISEMLIEAVKSGKQIFVT